MVNNRNWLSDAPIGAWYGVTIDESGRVVELDLRDNGLKGSVPPQLGQLSNLVELDLAWNHPAGAGLLLDLTCLFLHRNQMSSPIPPELGSLTNLGTMSLNSNKLNPAGAGTLPTWRI